MMFEELSKSVKASLYERVVSPLSGTFIFSWCIWNWKVIYTLISFGDETFRIRIEYIKNLNLDSCHIVVYPILSTFFLILVYPFIAHYAYYVALWHRKRLVELKWKFTDEEPISRQQAAQLKLDLRRSSENYLQELEEKNLKIKDLEDQIRVLGTEKNKSSNPHSPFTLNPSDRLEFIGIANSLKERKLDAEYISFAEKLNSGGEYIYWHDKKTPNFTIFDSFNLFDRHRSGANTAETVVLSNLGKSVYNHLKLPDPKQK